MLAMNKINTISVFNVNKIGIAEMQADKLKSAF